MIKLDEQEMEEAIDIAIETFWDDYATLYDVSFYGRNNTNMPNHEYVAPSYYSRSILRSLCVQLIAEHCGAEIEKVKGESSSDACSDLDHIKCPHCGHMIRRFYIYERTRE
jgi:DNA-directed RNA polymerase subunit RPC12/RpoP